MIKLVVSDMDGTLIGRDEELSESIINAVEKLRERGILFTVATGRVEEMAEAYVNKLRIDIPYIACNGATIVHGDHIVQRHTVPIKGLKKLFEQADSMGMSIIYTIEGAEYVCRPTPWIMAQRERFNRYFLERPISADEWDSLSIDKVTVMDDIRDGRIGLIDEMCQQLDPQYYGYTRYTDKAVEIVEKNANKGRALYTLAELTGISMEHIMAIGDHQNDMEMLKEAGLGVAVANGIEAVKAIADYVCSNCCAEGVIEAIEKFCLTDEKEA